MSYNTDTCFYGNESIHFIVKSTLHQALTVPGILYTLGRFYVGYRILLYIINLFRTLIMLIGVVKGIQYFKEINQKVYYALIFQAILIHIYLICEMVTNQFW